MGQVEVSLGDRAYTVHVECGAIDQCGALLANAVSGRRVLVIADANITHAEAVCASLIKAGFDAPMVRVEASERKKTLETVQYLLERAAAEQLDRAGAIVAVGGGVIGDIAGFVAASWLRGVPVVQVPTTLLAMVDASIGGKTAVNLRLPDGTLGKNLVGAFWQPVAVVSDPQVLSTLPRRERACGLAECVKHALIGDAALLDELRTTAPLILDGDLVEAESLIMRAAALKARVVAIDEREQLGDAPRLQRAFLNLGHTFAHAIEPIASLELKHGEAVAIRLVAAGACAQAIGAWGAAECEELAAVLESCELPTQLPESVAATALIERMGWDKKVARGQLTIVLPKARGVVQLYPNPTAELLQTGWRAVGAS